MPTLKTEPVRAFAKDLFRTIAWLIAILVITRLAASAATPSTTTLAANPSTAFATAPGNSVVLTATVTSGATGTVTFQQNGTPLTCAAGNPATLASGQAVCTTSFAGEGIHAVTAAYAGDATFASSTGTTNVFVQNHATNTGALYCNASQIFADGQSNVAFSHTTPYPSVIFVGDGVNTDLTGQVTGVSVTLKSLLAVNSGALHALLVAPDGTHALDFFSTAGSGAPGGGDYAFADGSAALPATGTLAPGTYGPTAYGTPPDPFTPGPPLPAPQLPATFGSAAPAGTATFASVFNGVAAHGAWQLFVYDGTGQPAALTGGWCLNLTAGTTPTTSLTLTASPVRAALGASVSLTATVTSPGGTVNTGAVTFTENGSALAGAPGGGVVNVVNGKATVSTTALTEGDHTINAAYADATHAFASSSGTVNVRVDSATAKPTLNGSVWSYCNVAPIVIPAGATASTNIGAAAPNPSNVFITNLPGTVASVGLTLKGLHLAKPNALESLLVGPAAAPAPNNLDFFSLGGGGNTFGPLDTSFLDSAPPLGAATPPAATNGPGSFGQTSYFASPFFTLPGTLLHAQTNGNFSFNTGAITATSGGVFTGTNANGTWSLYFNQTDHESGNGINGGWCLNFTVNPVVVSATASHAGNGTGGNFTQGETGAEIHIVVANAGPGPTGDPDGSHPLTVTDVLAADFTAGTLPTGAPWNCSATGQTVKCTSSSAVAAGSSYPQLVIPVKVAANAAASDTNSVTVSGGGATDATSNVDTILIGAPAPAGSEPKFKDKPTANPSSIWPPNGKLVSVSLDWSLVDPTGASCSVAVTSNQTLKDTDFEIVSLHQVLLRASRDGDDKGGRLYFLTVTCTNAAGSVRGTATVKVAHDQGNDDDQGDDNDDDGNGKGKGKGKGGDGDDKGDRNN
jgi:hypothetical protein